eukprot:scaffold29272_cov154-Skeletonema_menzelii.AAC.2
MSNNDQPASVPNPMAAPGPSPAPAATPAAAVESKPPAPAPAAASAAKPPTPQQQALQQQIQAQLQAQLQQQLQAAAAKGKQANITPEMIQAQAQAMVQAAAQAQAVVAAAKNRGGGLVPMNAAQISALSQIQAQAIVNARPQTALVGGTAGKTDEKPTPQQIQNQIQLQAQALVHAHTQAQIAAGIYKGGDPATSPATKAAAKPAVAVAAATAKASNSSASQQIKPPPQNELKPISTPYSGVLTKGSSATPSVVAAAAAAVPQPMELSAPPAAGSSFISDNLQLGENGEVGGVVMDPTSEEFLSKLNEALTEFWTDQLDEMKKLGTDKVETEQDFKNHNDLPLARIKRIMKSDEDVRMISAEAPVLFAKACEMFILEMTVRSWHYSENNKRKTLQKEDIREAIQRTDIFDFLVDVIH